MTELLYRMSFIFRPKYWVMIHTYSEAWDKKLNDMLDKPTFGKIDSYYAELNGEKIWIENWPYAYAEPTSLRRVRPRRGTIIRLRNAIEKHVFEGKQ